MLLHGDPRVHLHGVVLRCGSGRVPAANDRSDNGGRKSCSGPPHSPPPRLSFIQCRSGVGGCPKLRKPGKRLVAILSIDDRLPVKNLTATCSYFGHIGDHLASVVHHVIKRASVKVYISFIREGKALLARSNYHLEA